MPILTNCQMANIIGYYWPAVKSDSIILYILILMSHIWSPIYMLIKGPQLFREMCVDYWIQSPDPNSVSTHTDTHALQEAVRTDFQTTAHSKLGAIERKPNLPKDSRVSQTSVSDITCQRNLQFSCPKSCFCETESQHKRHKMSQMCSLTDAAYKKKTKKQPCYISDAQ